MLVSVGSISLPFWLKDWKQYYFVFRPLVCKRTLFWARSKARRRKRAKDKERERAKAKTKRIRRADTQERMRLKERSRRIARMMARMRAKWETEVLIHISFSSPNLIG